jgi:hypothetical protein
MPTARLGGIGGGARFFGLSFGTKLRLAKLVEEGEGRDERELFALAASIAIRSFRVFGGGGSMVASEGVMEKKSGIKRSTIWHGV